jgi:hypothetical protein
VILADPFMGKVLDTFNGVNLVNPVGGYRRIKKRYEADTECVAKRYASIFAFDKGDNATGVWFLQGTAENHQKYVEARMNYSTNSSAEILERAGGTYVNHCKSRIN